MKTYYILLLLFTFFAYSCKEDERGQYPVDNVPPGEVKSTQVENIAGGAIISYVIPEDDDLLYVKAIYTLDDGTVMEQKASEYASSLKIEGIGKSRELSVTIVTGDRSKNESKPVVVITHPQDSPIYTILASIQSYNDFGGIRLTWANPTKADVVLGVVTKNDAGEFISAQNFYTNAAADKGNLRGYPSVERVFGFYLRDRWGNMTDTIKNAFMPLFEEEIKGKIARWNPTGIPYLEYSPTYPIEKMWDGSTATASFYLQSPILAYPYSFTWDLGESMKFSRIHIWQRQGVTLVYITQAVQKFQLWGSATPYVSDSFTGWTYIGDFESIKPSGSPLGTHTAEDDAFGIAGQDYNIDAATPPLRYMRMVVTKTWSNDLAFAFGEMKFFGSRQ